MEAEGADVIQTIEELENLHITEEQIFIIGGAEIYAVFLPFVDELLVSKVHKNYTGNTKFPEFDRYFPEFKVIEEFDEFELRKYTK